MTAVKHTEIQQHLESLAQKKDKGLYRVYLLYGEEVLVKKSLQTLLKLLMPGTSSYGYEAWEGTSDNVIEAVQQLNTYALLEKGKVVALLDTPFFSSASKGSSPSGTEDQKNLPADRESEILVAALSDTFPDNHYLIMTAASVDKRRRLYKAVDESGLVVDCSVPKGGRQADKVAQDAILRESMQELLSRSDKRLDASAYAALRGMTGFDIRTFLNNLEKLIDYAGDRKNITVKDVSLVLERTKQDPIYEFTNALSDKDVGASLFYMESLLSSGYHELQLIAAAVNQVRRLLVMKQFAEETAAAVWQAGMPYDAFRNQIMPMVQNHDRNLKETLMDWERTLSEKGASEDSSPKKQAGSDLLMAPNPKNAYPVYKMMQKTAKFSVVELMAGLKALSRADGRLKSSGQAPRSILTDVVVRLCAA